MMQLKVLMRCSDFEGRGVKVNVTAKSDTWLSYCYNWTNYLSSMPMTGSPQIRLTNCRYCALYKFTYLLTYARLVLQLNVDRLSGYLFKRNDLLLLTLITDHIQHCAELGATVTLCCSSDLLPLYASPEGVFPTLPNRQIDASDELQPNELMTRWHNG